MADRGWISKFAFEDNALSADADGRAAMQDSYITGAKIGDGVITAAKFAPGALLVGVYGVGVYGTAVYG